MQLSLVAFHSTEDKRKQKENSVFNCFSSLVFDGFFSAFIYRNEYVSCDRVRIFIIVSKSRFFRLLLRFCVLIERHSFSIYCSFSLAHIMCLLLLMRLKFDDAQLSNRLSLCVLLLWITTKEIFALRCNLFSLLFWCFCATNLTRKKIGNLTTTNGTSKNDKRQQKRRKKEKEKTAELWWGQCLRSHCSASEWKDPILNRKKKKRWKWIMKKVALSVTHSRHDHTQINKFRKFCFRRTKIILSTNLCDRVYSAPCSCLCQSHIFSRIVYFVSFSFWFRLSSFMFIQK